MSTCPVVKVLTLGVLLGLASASGISQASPGTDTASLMEYWYRLTARDCGGRLASDCSGLVFRGITSKQVFLPWDPSPYSHSLEAGGTGIAMGGTSVSYLRTDTEYDGLGLFKFNGFALIPNDFVNKEKHFTLKVLCAFPIDAWTNLRTEGGCGDYQENGNTLGVVEDYCQKLSIATAKAWMDHYYRQANDPDPNKAHKFQCGFDTTRDYFATYTKADAFNTFVEARKLLASDPQESADARVTQTELRVETWPNNVFWKRDWGSSGRVKFDAPVFSDNDPLKATYRELPIAAFVYIGDIGKTDAQMLAALELAQDDQRRWIEQGNSWKPIVRVQLPRTTAEDARFAYYAQDQKAAPPVDSRSCDQYIEKLEWTDNYVEPVMGTISSLRITPTDCGRRAGVGKTDVVLAEVAIKSAVVAPNHKDWNFDRMGTSMRRQLACHLDSPEIALNKPTWSIEPARPYVAHDVIMQLPGDAKCNPH